MKTKKLALNTIKKFFFNLCFVLKIIMQSSWKTAISIIICSILSGIITPVHLYIWKYVIDSASYAISSGIFKYTVVWLFILSSIIIADSFLYRLNSFFEKFQVDYLDKYISNMVMTKIDKIDITYFDEAKIYDIVERINQQSTSRSISILTMLVSLIKNVTTFIGIGLIVFRFSPLIVLLCCVFTVPIFFANIIVSTKQYNIFVARSQKIRFIEHIKDLYTRYENIKELKIYRALPFFKNIVNDTYAHHISDDKSIRRKFLQGLSFIDILKNILSCLLKVYVLFIVVLYKKTLGDLTMYISSIESLEACVRSIMDSIASLYTDNLYMEDLIKLINIEEKKYDSPNLFNGKFSVIEFRNVYFKYPGTDKYCLEDINLKIYSNKVYALVGLNGSGKTTLVKLLMRLYDPTRGQIFIDGENITHFDRESLYKKMGVIFQDYIKYPLNIADNIGIGDIENIKDENKIRLSAHKSGADIFIANLPKQYQTYLHKEWDNGTELSIGQWQKLAISRAFMSDAAILILDEPSASLDPKSEYEIFEHFKDMIPNKTCILITHRFSNVILADEIFVLKDGHLIEHGNHKDLIRQNGLYCELYKMQTNLYQL